MFNFLLGVTASQHQPEPLGHDGDLPHRYGEIEDFLSVPLIKLFVHVDFVGLTVEAKFPVKSLKKTKQKKYLSPSSAYDSIEICNPQYNIVCPRL